ncbi:MAG: hypothetical protein JNK35_11580 [Phycisphaerae bacterium]|nr:hypothetical protein [Phycisphaerae bacterium]
MRQAAEGDRTDERPQVTPARLAAGIAALLVVLLAAYLFGFGGWVRILTALGLYQPAYIKGGLEIAPGPGPLTVASRELTDLRHVTAGVYNVLGELPASMDLLAGAEAKIPTIDPWGRPYRYHVSENRRTFWFSSDGPDGVEGTPDDLESGKGP